MINFLKKSLEHTDELVVALPPDKFRERLLAIVKPDAGLPVFKIGGENFAEQYLGEVDLGTFRLRFKLQGRKNEIMQTIEGEYSRNPSGPGTQLRYTVRATKGARIYFWMVVYLMPLSVLALFIFKDYFPTSPGAIGYSLFGCALFTGLIIYHYRGQLDQAHRQFQYDMQALAVALP